MMAMPVLETERCVIRPFAPSDLDACDHLFRAVWRSGARRDWMEWASRSAGELARLDQPPYGDRALVLRETNQIIGSVGLVPAFGPFGLLPGFGANPQSSAAQQHNVPEVGLFWMLAPSHRGNGHATEAARALITYAFETLNLRRVVATTERDNLPSQAVMRRLSLRIEQNPHPDPAWFQIVGVLENQS